MWNLYTTGKAIGKAWSEIIGIRDRWAAYQFDSAISYFGNAIESALLKQKKIGSGKGQKHVPKYELGQLLRADFRLPRPLTAEQKAAVGARNLIRMAKSLGRYTKVE